MTAPASATSTASISPLHVLEQDYPETRAVTARCLTIEEAFAEKLRALATRTRGRDLYDTWFSLQQDVSVEASLFERKMAAVGELPRLSIHLTEAEWDRDLSILLYRAPQFDDVLESVTDALTAAGIAVDTSPYRSWLELLLSTDRRTS